MTGSVAQVKGQYLRSIEMMVEVAKSLLQKDYLSKEVERLFKRLYVCMVYNYHDNLITRKDISSNAVQHEDGFDVLFPQLFTKNDNKEMMLRAFDEFEDIYHIEPIIKKYRKVRDHACAHFDESSTVADINNEIDTLDTNELIDVYKKMLRLFNYVCNNIFLLKTVSLPARIPIYDACIESVKNIENFYGEKSREEIPEELTCTEIMRAVRKKDVNYDRACESLRKKLMSHDDVIYHEIITAISQRLREPSVSDGEITDILNALRQSQNGFPERLQRSLLFMINDNAIFKLHNAHLLLLLSSVCREDKEIDIQKILDGIIKQKNIISSSLSLLALLHLTVTKNHSCTAVNNKAHEVSGDIIRYCNGITNPTEKCALMLVLAQHWFSDTEYGRYMKYETQYTDYFKDEMTKALDAYFSYIKLNNQEERDYGNQCLGNGCYLLLLYQLASLEESRNQDRNVYKQMWCYNCFYRTRNIVYESLGVGLMDELVGRKSLAKFVLESVVEDNPINKQAIQVLNDFYTRNKELR